MRHHLLAITTLGVILGWGLVFSATQHAGVITGIYWAVVTAFTVGYGDVVPHGDSGHLLAIAAIPTLDLLVIWTAGSTHLHHVRKTIQAGKAAGGGTAEDGDG